ncbi:MAG TPA: hypothetical protein DEG43_08920 [Acidimicrobiaceae bacterium]|jgi:anion-transporting  ArsA/GET3 family ATPase|nr:hypothetical protein [Acidimicrobiaceae bacterium]
MEYSTVSPSGDLNEQIRTAAVVVCCGSGGVGKTTTAAAIAIEAAHLGRRAVVVTIDPAKRLADALGIAGLSNTPTRITGPWSGELSALMLDTEGTFDALVTTYAGTPEQAEKIMGNRFYRNIAGALSGTQEYMATEKLYELSTSDEFDLVVVDTPPTRNALDFLEAPGRLARFLDHRLFRVVTAPTRGIVRAVNFAAQPFLRSVAKVVGGEVIADALGFFAAFDGMEEGFKQRARLVETLLSDDQTSFVLVASPQKETILEAQFFAERLSDYAIEVRAVIVNRVHPWFELDESADLDVTSPERSGLALVDYVTNLGQLASSAREDRRHLHELREATEAPIVEIPYLPFEIHDLTSLKALGEHLFGKAGDQVEE